MFDLNYFEVFLVWAGVSAVLALGYMICWLIHDVVCDNTKKPLEVYRNTLNIIVVLIFGVACVTYIANHKPVSISVPALTIQNSTITSEAADRLLKGRTISEASTKSR